MSQLFDNIVVNGLALGTALPFRAAVRVATTTNGTLSSAFANGSTVDGKTLATGDRILLKDQTTATENGIYVVSASGAPTRADDMDASSSANGLTISVKEGTTNATSKWCCTSVVGSDVVGLTICPFLVRISLLANYQYLKVVQDNPRYQRAFSWQAMERLL